MPENPVDVMMQIVYNGRALAGESSTVFAVGKTIDTLRTGFEVNTFCDLREFSFSVGAISKGEPKARSDASKFEQEIAKKASDMRQSRERKDGNRGNLDAIDIQPVQYTRIFDTASTLLFTALVGCETLDSVSIVKRKAAGTTNSGEIYLRLDFSQVLLTDLDWKDSEHVIEETGTFIYRQLTKRYRPQNSDGSLGSIVQMSWTMKS